MLPRVDLPEVILVMAWEPKFVQAFTAVSGGQTRLGDLHVSIAACLAAHALNIGYDPIVKKVVDALERDQLSHVNQNYLSTEIYSAANGWLIEAQAGIPLAQAWGGGLVAAVDGMRFVVPVPSIYARPNRKYFGAERGVTWLNMINDQAAGLGAKVVSGPARDSLHMLDVVFGQDGGQRPDIIVADTGSYSDVVFGLVHLLGMQDRRPARPAAVADQTRRRLRAIEHRGTRQDRPGQGAATLGRHPPGSRLDLHRDRARLRRSANAATRRAPHPLGDAIASYGRIFKSLHILAYIVDETYRRDIKGIRNLQEGRHSLAARLFHGKKGQLYQRYHQGMETSWARLV